MLWWLCRAPLPPSPRCRFTSVSLQFETVFIFHCCPLSHTHSLPPRASFHLFNKREALQAGESFRTKLKLLLGLNKNVFVPYQGTFSPLLVVALFCFSGTFAACDGPSSAGFPSFRTNKKLDATKNLYYLLAGILCSRKSRLSLFSSAGCGWEYPQTPLQARGAVVPLRAWFLSGPTHCKHTL